MATATPEKLPDGGGSSVGDERERTVARQVQGFSDQELRDKVQRLQVWLEGRVPPAWLPDRGEKLRLMLQAILDELDRRNGAARRAPLADPTNLFAYSGDAMAAATPEKLPDGGSRVGDGSEMAREVRDRVRQLPDRKLQEMVQRWKEFLPGPKRSRLPGAILPDGGEKIRLMLRAVLDELSDRRRQRAPTETTARVEMTEARSFT